MSTSENGEITVYFNPRCSKCRTARDLLAEHGASANLYEYLREAPTRPDIEHLMALLGVDDPCDMMRTGEDAFGDLDLANADRDELIDAMVDHPILIERPIVIRGDRAVIARPPERLLELLDS